jgi:hypothetical protein
MQYKSANILHNALYTSLSKRGFSKEHLMNKRRHLTIGGIVAAALLLLAPSCTSVLMVNLEAEAPGWTGPSGSLWVACNASVSGGGELSYEWSATAGNISGSGSQVSWVAPEEVGMYDITVVVTDSQDGQDSASIPLVVSIGPPPAIEDLNVTADHKYLRITTTGYKVAKTYDYTIDCVASGNGTLSYDWTCTDGNISGEGSTINWTAPDLEGTITVTAKVFDTLGNWVRRSVLLEVVPCTSCAFG